MNDNASVGEDVPQFSTGVSDFDLLFDELRQLENEASREAPIIQQELEKFNRLRKSINCEPLSFWKNSKDFPLLKAVADIVLAVPATSAPVERVFSQAGQCSNNRFSLSSALLIKEAMLRINKRLL